MKILELVDSVPKERPSKFAPIYLAAHALKDGQVLPVQFEDYQHGAALVQAILHRRLRRDDFPFRANQRGAVVYISRIES